MMSLSLKVFRKTMVGGVSAGILESTQYHILPNNDLLSAEETATTYGAGDRIISASKIACAIYQSAGLL